MTDNAQSSEENMQLTNQEIRSLTEEELVRIEAVAYLDEIYDRLVVSTVELDDEHEDPVIHDPKTGENMLLIHDSPTHVHESKWRLVFEVSGIGFSPKQNGALNRLREEQKQESPGRFKQILRRIID